MSKKFRIQIYSMISVIILIVSHQIAYASLKDTLLSNLLSDSDLIVDAFPIEIHTKENGAGWAIMKIHEIYKGNTDKAEIRIDWSNEEHDQKINTHRKLYLLFLKYEESNNYTGTHYGRSYWYLNADINNNNAYYTLYHYPIMKIKIDIPNILKPIKHVLDYRGKKSVAVDTEAIYLSDIKKLLSKKVIK